MEGVTRVVLPCGCIPGHFRCKEGVRLWWEVERTPKQKRVVPLKFYGDHMRAGWEQRAAQEAA